MEHCMRTNARRMLNLHVMVIFMWDPKCLYGNSATEWDIWHKYGVTSVSAITEFYIWLWENYKKATTMPVIRTGIYPHMPIADHYEIQIVYNTGRHRPCGGQFFTPHTVHGCPASLSHLANDRRTSYRFFNFWPWALTPGPKFNKRGDDLLFT